MTDLSIRTLHADDIPQMHQAFLEAFSDYAMVIKMDRPQFIRRFVDKLNIQFQLSGGAFHQQRMVGFIFTGIGSYDNLNTAYNGGTGVIPAYRGLGITNRIYQLLIPLFKKTSVEQCLLEVLTINKTAIKVYQKLNFQKSRLYRCFKLKELKIIPPAYPFKIADQPDFDLYESFWDTQPSFQDHSVRLARNVPNEKIIEINKHDQLAGYVIFQPELGRISQLAVNPAFRKQKIGARLLELVVNLSMNKNLTVLNINQEAKGLLGFLKKAGFENQVNQHEMYLKIN